MGKSIRVGLMPVRFLPAVDYGRRKKQTIFREKNTMNTMTRGLAISLAVLFLSVFAAFSSTSPTNEEAIYRRLIATLPINEIPMYDEGKQEKTPKMLKADADFIASIEKEGLSHKEGAEKVVQLGWSYMVKKDPATAIKRFNQAWLLDPENGNIYHGFAVITAMRGGPPAEVERFFKLAISKTQVRTEAIVDYGRFLWTEKRLDESLTQLNKAFQLNPDAENCRYNISFVYYLKQDFNNACIWAKDAQQHGAQLEKGFLDDVCHRAEKP